MKTLFSGVVAVALAMALVGTASAQQYRYGGTWGGQQKPGYSGYRPYYGGNQHGYRGGHYGWKQGYGYRGNWRPNYGYRNHGWKPSHGYRNNYYKPNYGYRGHYGWKPGSRR